MIAIAGYLNHAGAVELGARTKELYGLCGLRAVLDRDTARALQRFSLGTQPDRRPRLRRWRSPLLWISGSLDPRFSAMARDLQSAGVPAEFRVCPDAGHRVPWDNPSEFSLAVAGWVSRTLDQPRPGLET